MELVGKGAYSIDDMDVVRSLSSLESAALLAHFGAGDGDPTQQSMALELALEAKSKRCWIKCDCRRDKPALLFPRLTHSGVITLVRPCPTRQTPHDESCVFFLEESESQQRDIPRSIKNYCLLADPKDDTQRETFTTVKKETHGAGNQSALTKIFINALDKSSFSRLSDSYYPSYDQVVRTIRDFAKQEPLWAHGPLNLDDVLLTNVKYRIPFFHNVKKENRFDDSHRKQCYVLTLVTDVQEKVLLCQGDVKIEIEGSINIEGSCSTGPYLALLLCGEKRAGNGFFVYYRATLVPVYSEKLLFIVCSDPNREMVRHLIGWRQYWRSRDYNFELLYSAFKNPQWDGIVTVSDIETGRMVDVSCAGAEAKVQNSEGKGVVYALGEEPLVFKQNVSKALWASE